MVKTFLKGICEQLHARYGNDYSQCLVIFPTRRACLIFRKTLAAMHSSPVLAPAIFSIGDFVSRYAPVPVSEEIPLLLTLYDAWRLHENDSDFGRFFPWGQMMMNDFDEADKFLNHPEILFTGIGELRKIEAAFIPDPDQFHWVTSFLQSIDVEKLGKIRGSFVSNWNLLLPVYRTFNKLLKERGLAYEGKSYRSIVQLLSKGSALPPQQQILFAGFYGFSHVEEEMITALSNKRNVEILWDADAYYAENSAHEAGLYFRKSGFAQQHLKKTDPLICGHELNVSITGVSGNAGQAKYGGWLLRDLFRTGKLDPESTVMVLPDEQLLFPLLYSIPEEVGSLNVTMGYPLRQSPFTELVTQLRDLHLKHSSVRSGKAVFYYKAVQQLLEHPLIRKRSRERVNYEKVDENFLDAAAIEKLFGFKGASRMFRTLADASSILDYLDEFYSWNDDQVESHASRYESITLEYIRIELGLLREHLTPHISDIKPETAWQMVKECLNNLKVPFSGEPVHGLQIMGFLETRALDFKTVILFSANEGILPATGGRKSFIPYSLRKGFGLETYEDQDATFAYHFYRLFHRSSDLFIVYNTEQGPMGGGERSRYLLQIVHELKSACGEKLHLSQGFHATGVPEIHTAPPVMKKNDQVLERLAAYVAKEGIDSRKFSPSGLSKYINCKLQFYFQYIAGLREPDDPEKGLDAAIFGSILHRSMELVYKKYLGMEVSNHDLEEALAVSDQAVNEAFLIEYRKLPHRLEGEELLTLSAIKNLVKRIITQDLNRTPFVLKGLENGVEANLESVRGRVALRGTIDRLESKDGADLILDYKTGKVAFKVSDLEQLFTEPKMQTAFQLLCYSWIYRKSNPGSQIKSGFYVVKKLGGGNKWINGGEILTDQQFDDFESRLTSLVNEILDPLIDFTPTPEVERCKYCPYVDICNR